MWLTQIRSIWKDRWVVERVSHSKDHAVKAWKAQDQLLHPRLHSRKFDFYPFFLSPSKIEICVISVKKCEKWIFLRDVTKLHKMDLLIFFHSSNESLQQLCRLDVDFLYVRENVILYNVRQVMNDRKVIGWNHFQYSI